MAKNDNPETTTQGGSSVLFTPSDTSNDYLKDTGSGSPGQMQANFRGDGKQNKENIHSDTGTGEDNKEPDSMDDKLQQMGIIQLTNLYKDVKEQFWDIPLYRCYMNYFVCRTRTRIWVGDMPPDGDICKMDAYKLRYLNQALESDLRASECLLELQRLTEKQHDLLNTLDEILQMVREKRKGALMLGDGSCATIYWWDIEGRIAQAMVCRNKLIFDWRRLGEGDLGYDMFDSPSLFLL